MTLEQALALASGFALVIVAGVLIADRNFHWFTTPPAPRPEQIHEVVVKIEKREGERLRRHAIVDVASARRRK